MIERIYGLTDPRDGAIVYVGCTSAKLRSRLAQHIGMRKQDATAKSAWLCEISALGERPGIVELETCDERVSSEREKFWIGYLREAGAVLLNAGAGGQRGGRGRRRHGATVGGNYAREWLSWNAMRARCYNKNSERYLRYGGRGIRVCARWRESNSGYAAFLHDMGPAPEGTTIDRVDNNGHYSCGACEECVAHGWTANCRWATKVEQANKRSNNVLLAHDGIVDTVSNWARRRGLTFGCLQSRVYRGWDVAKALDTPLVKREPRQPKAEREVVCECCGRTAVAKTILTRWCNDKCRKKLTRNAFYRRNRDRICAQRRVKWANRRKAA